MTPRSWFTTAATGFLHVVDSIAPEQLDRPGLGEWDVRSLLGHAARAFLTIETYLAAESGEVTLNDPAEYFVATRAGLADPVAVTERGRTAGKALGAAPTSTVRELAYRVQGLVENLPDDAVAMTPVGGIRLIDYLPTRAFELTVHGLDLAAATGQSAPAALLEAAAPALELAVRISRPDQRIDLLLAMTGRQRLAEGFSIL